MEVGHEGVDLLLVGVVELLPGQRLDGGGEVLVLVGVGRGAGGDGEHSLVSLFGPGVFLFRRCRIEPRLVVFKLSTEKVNWKKLKMLSS